MRHHSVQIVDLDFDKLDKLYKKACVLAHQLRNEIRRSMGLILEEISEFAPTTAAILLPWVTKKILPYRAHEYRAFLGVTFTPSNIRIGLDFGSRAHLYKEKYYKLLLKRELEEEVKSLYELDKQYLLSEAYNTKEPFSSYRRYCFYDTFWYYHIRNLREVSWYGESYETWTSTRLGKIRDVGKALFPYFLPLFKPSPFIKSEIERALKELQQQTGKSMTGHRLLVGRVIKRDSEEFPKVLRNISNEITNTFREIYPILAKIEANS